MITCFVDFVVEHGTLTPDFLVDHGSSVLIKCDTGYEINGNSTRLVQKAWTPLHVAFLLTPESQNLRGGFLRWHSAHLWFSKLRRPPGCTQRVCKAFNRSEVQGAGQHHMHAWIWPHKRWVFWGFILILCYSVFAFLFCVDLQLNNGENGFTFGFYAYKAYILYGMHYYNRGRTANLSAQPHLDGKAPDMRPALLFLGWSDGEVWLNTDIVRPANHRRKTRKGRCSIRIPIIPKL